MLAIIEKPPINKAIQKRITRIYRRLSTRLELLSGKRFQCIGNIQARKGILQEDSLSPLLFILGMQTLTKLLDSEFEPLRVSNSNDTMSLNKLFGTKPFLASF